MIPASRMISQVCRFVDTLSRNASMSRPMRAGLSSVSAEMSFSRSARSAFCWRRERAKSLASPLVPWRERTNLSAVSPSRCVHPSLKESDSNRQE